MLPHPKVIVAVEAIFDINGSVTPTAFVWEDGRRYEIDRVIDVREAAALKAGGHGTRYTCVVRGKQVYLFWGGRDGVWFMERK